MFAHTDFLVTPSRLAELIAAENCVVVDCRFDFTNPAKGRQDYLAGHIPGAHHASLDDDLSSPVTSMSGRHPLPEVESFSAFLGRIGWTGDKLLVAHDERNNALSSRLWWLMRYFGQDAALLDGGLEAWSGAGLPLESGLVTGTATAAPKLSPFTPMTVSVTDILNDLGRSQLTLIDARATERFNGETEPLDTRAGHIPGALNRPLSFNLEPSGQFKKPQQLRAEFEALLDQRSVDSVVHSCGSGVTACHNQFAMELAGLGTSRIYPGSWSEWLRDESRPIETGS